MGQKASPMQDFALADPKEVRGAPPAGFSHVFTGLWLELTDNEK
jgi:hypothetical protein